MSVMNSAATLTRRQVLTIASGAALVGLTSRILPAHADAAATQALIKERLGDKPLQEGRIKLQLPQIAENGNTVPLSFAVESPMTAEDYVKSVHLFAEDNPLPGVATFNFTPRSGKAEASTRIRLAKTQNVIAVAEMSDGSVYIAKNLMKVTMGGCSG